MTPAKNPLTDFDKFQYVPYFYQSGKFQYATPARKSPVQYQTPYNSYDFTSNAKSLFDPDQPQTVEQIIYHGYLSIPTGDPVTAMITDSRHTAWLGLDDAIGQIRKRYEIYQQNIYELLLSQCSAINTFLKHCDRIRPDQPDDRLYYSLNKNLQRLYSQEREERIDLWRDISRIRQSLPESAQRYLSAFRKSTLMDEEQQGDQL
jgi:hypothetical protein